METSNVLGNYLRFCNFYLHSIYQTEACGNVLKRMGLGDRFNIFIWLLGLNGFTAVLLRRTIIWQKITAKINTINACNPNKL